MRRNRIRLTESQLHRVIKESVKRVLRESKTEIFSIQGFNNTQDESIEYPMNLFGTNYETIESAWEAAEEAAPLSSVLASSFPHAENMQTSIRTAITRAISLFAFMEIPLSILLFSTISSSY